MKKDCGSCKFKSDNFRVQPCESCTGNFSMWEAKKNISYDTVITVDSKNFEKLLICLNEAITGLNWRIENEPTTMDNSDYDKLSEWINVLSKFSSDYWAYCMLNKNK